MFKRQKTGSVVCRSCGLLVGVRDEQCFNCGARYPSLWGFAPMVRKLGHDLGFVHLVTGGCALLYLVALLIDPAGIRSGGIFSLLGPSSQSLFVLGASGAVPVYGFGRWWTFLSAGWLHGGLLHIFFNLMWIRQLGPLTAEIYGVGRMVIIYTVASVLGFLLSSWAGAFLTFMPGILQGARFTVGASAAIFGLLGALIYSGRRGGSSMVGRQAQSFAVILFLFGFLMPNIDNWAHLGGFLGGYGMARWLDPMKPERIDHLFAAVACIVLSAAAIAYSIVHGLQFLG